jgi:cardiolipin synthase
MIINDVISKKIADYHGGCAVSADCTYFGTGEETAAYLLDALSKARSYIFLEFFTIEKGVLWNKISEILKRKAAAGVDVRVVYDRIGSLFVFPKRLIRELTSAGVKVRAFKPANVNHRNHRKIAAMDSESGHTTFVGGLNLSDRYANLEEKWGHWKDSAVMIREPDVWEEHEPGGDDTIAVPMFDEPRIRAGEHTFINFISTARDCVYITTPYLMCGSGLLSVMSAAALSGVDVRVITPFIADKRAVKLATESYYKPLIDNKVRVFEYIPGFIHAKSIIADGKRGAVGSANLDYRSLYLNFECGVCLFGGKAVADLQRDFDETFALCKEITHADLAEFSAFKRGLQRFCRVFARIW